MKVEDAHREEGGLPRSFGVGRKSQPEMPKKPEKEHKSCFFQLLRIAILKDREGSGPEFLAISFVRCLFELS